MYIVRFHLKKSSKTHPLVVKYAKIIGRTPSALNMKIGNIGRLDPDLQKQGITGLTNGATMEKTVWNEFYGNPERLAYESEKLLQSIEDKVSLDYIKQLIGTKINRPDRFLPQRELLDIHHNKYLSIQ